jgi:hypothetical protein
VAQWNDAKQGEFDDRKLFDSSINPSIAQATS